jgi:hypothetical protein
VLQFGGPNRGAIPGRVINRHSGMGVEQRYEWIVEEERNEEQTDKWANRGIPSVTPGRACLKLRQHCLCRLVGVGLLVNTVGAGLLYLDDNVPFRPH